MGQRAVLESAFPTIPFRGIVWAQGGVCFHGQSCISDRKRNGLKTQSAISNFEITSWEQSNGKKPSGGPTIGRATVRKTFTGDLEGTSVAELLTCQADDGSAGYVASELVEGGVGDRTGTFVVQHGGTVDGTTATPFGHVVPGSGTGDLKGLRGKAEYQLDENCAILKLDYEFV